MTKYQAELYHHGIKGQKWGIRRFQNEDGTYTNAGKERRNTSDSATKAKSSEYPKQKGAFHKKLSNDELKQRIERLKLEKEYLNLKRETIGPGKSFVLDVLTSIGKKSLTQLGVSGVMEAANRLARKKRTYRTTTDKDGNEKTEVDFDPTKFYSTVKDQW